MSRRLSDCTGLIFETFLGLRITVREELDKNRLAGIEKDYR